MQKFHVLLSRLLIGTLIIILASCLSGCQPATQTDTAITPTPAQTRPAENALVTPLPSPTPAPVIQVKPEELKYITVQFWHPWTGNTEEEIRILASKFNVTNSWGIIVEVKSQNNYTNLYDQVSNAIANNEQPDLVIAYPEQALNWDGSARTLLNLNDYIEDPNWGLSEDDIADFLPLFWEQGGTTKRRWGIPAESSGQFLFYNQSWANELGFSTPPATITEFRTQACAAAQANLADNILLNNGTGGWVVDRQTATTLGWFSAFGGQILSPNGSEYTFDTEENNAAFSYLKDLYDDGCAWTGRAQQSYDYFANRYALFYAGSLRDIPLQIQTNTKSDTNDQWIIIPFPAQGDKKPVTIVSGTYYTILKSTPQEQLAAWLFLRWLISPENQAQIIKANGAMPVRDSTFKLLNHYGESHPQWAMAQKLITNGVTYSYPASWRLVRNIVSDATAQLFQAGTTPEDIPTILSEMDEMASELNTGNQ
jgi:multiple sugar transport system substrate-binding protein